MAQRPADIDEARVEELIRDGASINEIGHLLNVDDATITRRCRKLIDKVRAERRVALRKLQWASAASGNAALLIWLGKNELGQSDQVTATINRIVVEYADMRRRGIDGGDDTDNPPEAASRSDEDSE